MGGGFLPSTGYPCVVHAIAKRCPHDLTDVAAKTRYGVLKRVRARMKNNGQRQKRSAGIGIFQARLGADVVTTLRVEAGPVLHDGYASSAAVEARMEVTAR